MDPADGLAGLDALRQNAIVLVHGAWVGEWSWDPVLTDLTASGRRVIAVSLTGHGAKRQFNSPDITLSTHVDDVVQAVEVADLRNITLVGHSYGGRVITAAAPAIGDRIAAMVYLDAHAPLGERKRLLPERAARAEANGGLIPYEADRYRPDPDVLGGADGVAWFLDRVAPQSAATLAEAWDHEIPASARKTFVYCTENQPSNFTSYATIAKDDDDWTYIELAAPHFLMSSHPVESASIILNA